MHPPLPEDPARRSAAHALSGAALLLITFALGIPTDASAGPLYAGGSHVGEDHSFEDHHGESLREIDLSAADLTSADLRGADLKDALLVEAILVDAVLASAVLRNADLTGADLTGADLTGAIAKNAIFAGARLDEAVLVGSNLKNADFSGAHLLGTDLSSVIDGDHALFTGAFYDAATLLDPAIDTSGMLEVVGACPWDPDTYWVDSDGDGLGDTCTGAALLPEPGDSVLLASGVALLVALARRRRLPGTANPR